MKRIIIGLVFTLASGFSVASDEPLMISTKRLTLSTATKIAQAAIAECTKQGIQIGVTVVDREGNVQVVLRDTIAAPITLLVSREKAYTAVNFNTATSNLVERGQSAIGRVPGLYLGEGGVPIQVAGSLVGAVGVSGGVSGITDEACAQAGVDAVQDDLEMSM